MSEHKEEPILRKTGARVLEDWGMMMVDEVSLEKNPFDFTDKFYISSVCYRGPINGTLSILAQKAFMDSLCRNLLGLDETHIITEGDGEDTFRELANVLLGNFLTEAYGEELVFDLNPPNVTHADREKIREFLKNRKIYYFAADQKPVAFSFTLDA